MSHTKMKNKRYRKTEEAIFRVFFGAKGIIAAKELARKAGISRITLYRHHPLVQNIALDYERYLLGEYAKVMQRISGKEEVGLKIVYLQMLIFTVREKEVILALLKQGRRVIIEKMIWGIEPRIMSELRLDKGAFELYVGGVFGLMDRWSKSGFIEEKIEEVLGDIMRFTKSAKKRLKLYEH